MKRLIFLLLGFFFIMGSPVIAHDFDNDVGIEYVVPCDNIDINQTTTESTDLVSLLNKQFREEFLEANMSFNVTYKEVIYLFKMIGKKVAFVGKHPIGIYVLNSYNEGFDNYKGFDFGDINELDRLVPANYVV